jgi:TolB-like protein/DNA-binding winged helix-turn-helix (wHTH) protein/cytochrome c-type biogenesis protein CcmH/NrfG
LTLIQEEQSSAPRRAERGDAVIWRFGSVELDERDKRLSVDGAAVPLDRSGYDLLLCLVHHAGEVVPKEELLRVGWPGRVVTENSLAKAIGRLRQALGDPDGECLRVVHGYGYRLVADFRRDGARREYDPAGAQAVIDLPVANPSAGTLPAAPRRRWWTPLLVGTTLLLAAVGAIHVGSRSPAPALAVTPSSPQTATSASIAILPFLDLSEQHDQGYFSDGLAEQLLDSLARVPQIRVVSRTSSFAFRGGELDLRTIGSKLNAQTVLEGSVRKSADRIRVTVQLIKSVDGYHLWSETYDRPITELFAMQDEIVRAIVSALRIELLPDQQRELVRHAKTSAAAYEEFLLAHDVYKDDETAHRRSMAHFERAVELDPDFVEAWCGLADILGQSGMYADNADEALAGKRRALQIVDRVIALAPDNPDGWKMRGVYRTAHWWDWTGAEQDLQRAAALSPIDQEQPLVELARLRAAQGRLNEAIEFETRATQINPHSGNAWTVMGYHLTALGRFDKAREILTQAIRIQPLDEHARYYLGLGELLQGRTGAALPHFEDSAHFLRLTGQALAHHSLGDRAAADQDLQLLIARYGHILPYQAAEVYAWRGDKDKAFEWLDRAYELHDASFIYYSFDPLLRNLHDDSRYGALLKKLGLPLPVS